MSKIKLYVCRPYIYRAAMNKLRADAEWVLTHAWKTQETSEALKQYGRISFKELDIIR